MVHFEYNLPKQEIYKNVFIYALVLYARLRKQATGELQT